MNPSLSGLPRAFAHPMYWAALALLLVNDHLLKGAGVAPAWLTGKLSDFAGLIVAPPVLAALLLGGFGVRRAKVIALAAPAAVGLGFAAIKLDATAAHHAEQLFRGLGVASRIWLDPTDLFALAVLPLSAMLCRPERAPLALGALRVPAVVVASFACIATTGGGEEEGSGSEIPELKNETEETLIVHIASTNGAGGCRIYREERVGVLTPDAFALRREVVVKPGGSAALTGDLAVPFDTDCGAMWITLPDGRQELVYFADLPKIEEGSEAGTGTEGRRVTLRGETNRFRFELGEDLRRFELSSEPLEGNCNGREPEHTVEATALALAPGFYDLESKARDEADGCLVVTWIAQTSEPVMDEQRLCIPDWAFPFEEGETLSLIEEVKGTGARRLRITRYDDELRVNQQLTIWNHTEVAWESHIKALVAEDCIGSILECGAYSRPVQVELNGDDGVIVAGDDVDLNIDKDEIRLLVGAGQEIGWSAAACMGDEARTGLSVNLLELRTD